ncbi:hypothetical protein L873DRAFT_1811074 [Choiromyces venosus 120613-1]|uniref:Uncharacterized protein n=1 Tax=Choiromyces venosus 120613-1 TaxID=1336337 RepID=A0A3N4JEL0_9PEZI|nr:hypothetical protein L873DRAFT_1811074 [Choiromyces venosus 120613-1]
MLKISITQSLLTLFTNLITVNSSNTFLTAFIATFFWLLGSQYCSTTNGSILL